MLLDIRPVWNQINVLTGRSSANHNVDTIFFTSEKVVSVPIQLSVAALWGGLGGHGSPKCKFFKMVVKFFQVIASTIHAKQKLQTNIILLSIPQY